MMTLAELITRAGLAAGGDVEPVAIDALTCDSREAGAGVCFVAVRGSDVDGHRFIPQAVAAGCVAVICEDSAKVPAGVPCVVLPETRLAAGRLAQAFYDDPAKAMTVIGITGTNGKSTVAWILREMLAAHGCKAGLLGTIEYDTGGGTVPAGNTTPGPMMLAKLMAEMVANGCTHVVMEVSSHALDQHRIEGIDVDVAIWMNLTGDHLDYHHDMDQYAQAKQMLFTGLRPDAAAILNRDDSWAEAFAQVSTAPITWYGLSTAADIHARIDEISTRGTRFGLITPEGDVDVTTPLIGRHNVFNSLAAATAGRAMGMNLAEIAQALSQITCIPGRLQRVASSQPFDVFVDYAHTDDALVNVLGALRPVTTGQLLVVFGCGGDRDRTKRPRMAQAAADRADTMVITSDNPRTEAPEAVVEDILAGLNTEQRSEAIVELDRRRAIEMAIGAAGPGDVVLIAGKGHETYQIIGSQRHDFDDVQVASEILSQLGATS
jgi:UDP-N-acetylmuramoyl-L-alanyl-D-glutamate--2,6-diaminopimelate ligase